MDTIRFCHNNQFSDMEHSFDASTQYSDFHGTAKADGYMSASNVESDLKELGVPIGDNESLVGLSLSFAEIMRPHKIHVNMGIKPYVYAFFEQNGETQNTDPVPLRKVRLEFETVEHFLRIFKRFEVRLSLYGEMNGRTYIETNLDEEYCKIPSDKLDLLQ